MKSVKIVPHDLQGTVKAPSSKSLCHRAIIAAGLSNGISNIENITFSDDIVTTCKAMESLGIDIMKDENTISIKGAHPLNPIKNEIDCKESGSTLRFLIPLALLTGESITFKGRGMLIYRPLTPYYEILDSQHIYYSTKTGLPLTVRGILSPGDYEIKGNISSQFITGLMLALPLLDSDSRITVSTPLESRPYVDLTIEMMKRFSVFIETRGSREFYIKGNQKYAPTDYRVEGDFSQASFWMAAGILGQEVICSDIFIDSLQGDKVIMDIIKEMGGNVLVDKDKIITRRSRTRGLTVDASQCPDLVPILSVLGALSEGTTKIVNAGRLRIKESDRLKAVASELVKLGADVRETENGLVIKGKDLLDGGVVDSWNDHRIAMALSIASIRCKAPVIITNADSVKKSYPNFFQHFSILGGMLDERDMGKQY